MRFFVLANGAYSMAPQVSYGITFGMVHRLGWYVNINSNFKARKSSWYDCYGDGWISGLTNYSYTGEKSTSRFSATAGLVFRLWRPVYLYLGGGYGWRNLYWLYRAECEYGWASYEYGWARNIDYSYQGAALDGGLLFRFNKVGVSLGVQTVGINYVEAKLGLGIVF